MIMSRKIQRAAALAVTSFCLVYPFQASAEVGCPSTDYLQHGYECQAVKDLQQLLTVIGYFDGSVDGVFGLATQQAVESFQQDYGLIADGIAGPETRRRMARVRDGRSR